MWHKARHNPLHRNNLYTHTLARTHSQTQVLQNKYHAFYDLARFSDTWDSEIQYGSYFKLAKFECQAYGCFSSAVDDQSHSIMRSKCNQYSENSLCSHVQTAKTAGGILMFLN